METNDSLKKLRRDFGKVWEIFCQLVLALERRGGTVENLFSLLNQKENRTVALFHSVAALLMGEQRLVHIDPLEILTKTGKSDDVRRYAVTAGGIKEEDLPISVLFDPEFCYPRTRLAIVERLNDQAKLKEIALNGEHSDANLAVKKITSVDDLYDIATNPSGNSACFTAVRRLPETYLDRFISIWPGGPLRMAAIQRVTEIRAQRL